MKTGEPFAGPIPRSLDAVVEDARLAALNSYRTLAPHDADGLSRLSREAAGRLGATQAAVSFVDESRVWFGGAFGFARSETERAHSFCDTVVRSSAPLLVPDGLSDPRFCHHEMIRGDPGLRCYAGAPLIDAGGYTVGTVAVYSLTPGVFSAAILQHLVSLAALVRDFLTEARAAPTAALPLRRVQGWLGVKTLETSEGKAGTAAGLVVLSVARGSPARRAGIRPTDILQSIGGKELFVSADVAAAMEGIEGGLTRVQLRRTGQTHEVGIEIAARRRRITGR